ncbi:hypothetical protein T12_3372 [Trichinella patagoniensis]|uniref:Uncharacterized protein n=1 Tax=Trichinella patagoniensis TaxID=990121 RepID=A0A0V0ZJX7_9BILA|nr:hypothetical protein T12_3372 [Trichinella patagoniensis]
MVKCFVSKSKSDEEGHVGSSRHDVIEQMGKIPPVEQIYRMHKCAWLLEMLKTVRTTAKLSVPKPVIFGIDTSIHIKRSVVVIVAAVESIQFDDKLSELHVQHDKSKNDLSCNAKQEYNRSDVCTGIHVPARSGGSILGIGIPALP